MQDGSYLVAVVLTRCAHAAAVYVDSCFYALLLAASYSMIKIKNLLEREGERVCDRESERERESDLKEREREREREFIRTMLL